MNEAINNAQCGDDYSDALTLGPFPGIADSVDVTVKGAAVFAQLYRNVDTGVQSSDPREYLLLPGSRTISNVTGIRFRNQFAGVPALVTASLGGPDIPQIGAIFADVPTIGAPLLVPTPIKLDAAGSNGLGFSGIPPTGYSGLLVLIDTGTAGPLWVSIRTSLPGFGSTEDQSVWVPAVKRAFYVMALPASTVSIRITGGVANATVNWLGVWPTNLPPGTYLPPVSPNIGNPVLFEADGTLFPAGVTTADLVTPFFGPAELVVPTGLPANTSVFVYLQDQTGNRLGFELGVPVASPPTVVQGLLVPGRHIVEVVNTSGGGANLNFSLIGQYGGITA